jgi:hypothetical protein
MVIEGELTLVTDAGLEMLPAGSARPVRLWFVVFKRRE